MKSPIRTDKVAGQRHSKPINYRKAFLMARSITRRAEREPRFPPHRRRQMVARPDGGNMAPDSDIPILGEVDRVLGAADRLAGCFRDYRNPDSITPSLR